MDLLTVDDVAKLLNATKSFVWKLAREKKLRCYRPGGRILRFDKKDVERFISESLIEKE